MKVSNCQENLKENQPGLLFTHESIVFEQSKKLPSRTVLHNQNVKMLSLNILLHINDERMI